MLGGLVLLSCLVAESLFMIDLRIDQTKGGDIDHQCNISRLFIHSGHNIKSRSSSFMQRSTEHSSVLCLAQETAPQVNTVETDYIDCCLSGQHNGTVTANVVCAFRQQ